MIELKVLIEVARMVKSEYLLENIIIITNLTIMVITIKPLNLKGELVQAGGKTQVIKDMVTIVLGNRVTIARRGIVTIAIITIVRDIRVKENL